MLGSSRAARDEIEQIKNFVTGPTGGFLAFADAEKGVEILQMQTGGAIRLADALRVLSGAQAVSGKTAADLGQEIGRVSNQMLAQAPIRYMMLDTLVKDKIITAQNAVEIENMSKKGEDGRKIFEKFMQMLHQNDDAAKEASQSFGGLSARLDNIVKTRVLEPLGAGLAKALAGPLKDFDNWLERQAPAIEKMAKNFAIDMAAAIDTIRDQGLGELLGEGLEAAGNKFVNFLTETDWIKVLDGINDALEKAGQNFVDWIAKHIFDFINRQLATGALPGGVLPPGTLAAAAAGTASKQAMERYGAGDAAYNAWSQSLKTATGAQEGDTAAVKSTTTGLGDFRINLAQAGIDLIKWAQNLPMPGAPGMPYAGPTGGPSVITHYGYPGDPKQYVDALGHALKEGVVALSPDMEAQFRALGGHIGQQIEISLANGQKMIGYFADRTREDLRGRVDLYDPRNLYAALSGASVTGIRPLAAFGPPGSPLYTSPGPGTVSAFEAHRIARLQEEAGREAAAKEAAGKLTGVPTVDKAAKGELTEQKSLIDQMREAEERYGVQIELVEQRRKAHMETNQQAFKEELAIYQQEYNEISRIRTALQAAYDAEVKAHGAGTKLAEQLKMDLAKADVEVLKLAGDMQKLGAASSFMGQVQEALTHKIEEFSFNGTKAVDLLAQSFENFNSALLSVEEGTTKASDAFKKMAQSILADLQNMLLKQIEAQLMNALNDWVTKMREAGGGGGFWGSLLGALGLGGGGGGGGGFTFSGGMPTEASELAYVGAQHGGYVIGPSGTDRVHAQLTSGEYVLSQSAVGKYGIAMIDALNRGTWGMGPGQRFAGGGLVGAASSAANIPPNMNPAGGSVTQAISVVTNVTVPSSAGTVAEPGTASGASPGLSKQDVNRFQNAISLAVKDEIVRQKRPGGLLSKHQLT
jgi:hypothetical protein